MNDLPCVYIVRVKPVIAAHWLAMFTALEVSIIDDDTSDPQTALLLHVADQAQLMGVLSEMHGMGLQLLSVQREAVGAAQPCRQV